MIMQVRSPEDAALELVVIDDAVAVLIAGLDDLVDALAVEAAHAVACVRERYLRGGRGAPCARHSRCRRCRSS